MKPIGYWLNRTDRALTTTMDALLAEYGLTRLAWQVLNTLADGSGATDAAVRTALAAHADAPTLTAAIEGVLCGGWAVRPEPGRLALTGSGRARLAEAGAQVGAFRERATAGISPREYRTAVEVLERMTRNLEPAAP
ncbi:MarR family winged helix-turn-helix transcriptional regulator [Streptomyces racemochromogenes]|uniref:MarR family winged helix-turn-helix transcriptional regulator n=1 Tax=Streptomyces racemochromogenes TaxID=67353 RepID=A0ABW7PJ43_9ACTN